MCGKVGGQSRGGTSAICNGKDTADGRGNGKITERRLMGWEKGIGQTELYVYGFVSTPDSRPKLMGVGRAREGTNEADGPWGQAINAKQTQTQSLAILFGHRSVAGSRSTCGR